MLLAAGSISPYARDSEDSRRAAPPPSTHPHLSRGTAAAAAATTVHGCTVQ